VTELQLTLAFLADLAFGDPQWMPRPVRLFGVLTAAGEKVSRLGVKSNRGLLVAGGVVAAVITLGTYGGSRFVLSEIKRLSPFGGAVATVYLAYATLSVRGLDEAGREVIVILRSGKVEAARRGLGKIVGRDTKNLDETEIVRAVIETVAENSSDGVVASLFYLALGGVPAALTYKAINTMDSMIGYKNDQYLFFGRVAARLDDVANFIPSRIAASLAILASLFLRLAWRNALHITLRDASLQPSPNSGYPQAAFAGALRIRLGGTNFYGGQETRKAYLGDPERSLGLETYSEVRRLLYGTSVIALFASLAFLALLCRLL